jgi:hypothetical protein
MARLQQGYKTEIPCIAENLFDYKTKIVDLICNSCLAFAGRHNQVLVLPVSKPCMILNALVVCAYFSVNLHQYLFYN